MPDAVEPSGVACFLRHTPRYNDAGSMCITQRFVFPTRYILYLGGNYVEEQASIFGGLGQCRVIAGDQVVNVVERILGLGVLEEFLLHLWRKSSKPSFNFNVRQPWLRYHVETVYMAAQEKRELFISCRGSIFPDHPRLKLSVSKACHHEIWISLRRRNSKEPLCIERRTVEKTQKLPGFDDSKKQLQPQQQNQQPPQQQQRCTLLVKWPVHKRSQSDIDRRAHAYGSLVCR